MAEETSTGSASAPAAAAAAVSPDPLIAELLRRQAAGDKLTPHEYGKLGAWKARLKGVPLGRPKINAGPAPLPMPGQVAAGPGFSGQLSAPGQTPGDLPGPPAIDPDLVRRTIEAIFKTCDGIAQTWVLGQSKKAGADDTTARLFAQAAALPAGPKDLMVSTSPEVAASLGLDTRNYPVAAFLTGLGIWSTSLMLAVSKIQSLQKEHQARTKEKPPEPAKKEEAAP